MNVIIFVSFGKYADLCKAHLLIFGHLIPPSFDCRPHRILYDAPELPTLCSCASGKRVRKNVSSENIPLGCIHSLILYRSQLRVFASVNGLLYRTSIHKQSIKLSAKLVVAREEPRAGGDRLFRPPCH